MKRLIIRLVIAATICVAMLSLTSCQKETWDFNYPKEQLCGGHWSATHASTTGGNGYWSSMSSLHESFMLIFHEDGKYFSSGSFNASSSTHSWDAHGNTIDIYSGKTKIYTWTVESWGSGSTIEMKMSSGNSSIYYRFEKR